MSQGNSPRKQSLIPQPRGGLTSHRAKTQKNKDRDKWERRSGRYVTRIPRSSSLKAPAKRPTGETIRAAKSSTKKTTTTTTKTPGVSTGAKNSAATKAADKKINRSPTKIPVRYAAFAPNGSVGGGNNAGGGRFIQISDKNDKQDKKEINSPAVSSESSSVPATTDDSVVIAGEEIPVVKPVEQKENDPGLVDLLKHPTKGEGTKSVVSATTTTAVQPLKIDATNIILHESTGETAAVVTNTKDDNNKKSSQSFIPEQIKSDTKIESKTEAKAETKVESKVEAKVEPKTKTLVAGDKISDGLQSVEAVVEPMNVEALVENIKPEDNKELKKIKDEKIAETKATDQVKVQTREDNSDKKLKTDETDRIIQTAAAGSLNPEDDKRQDQKLLNERTDQTQDKLRNHGSETSLKSSNGLSTCSVESIRSTDTGVSLNTVRGVSSAREKRGTHVVKRSQEIETLSGNVMNIENRRNGEPA